MPPSRARDSPRLPPTGPSGLGAGSGSRSSSASSFTHTAVSGSVESPGFAKVILLYVCGFAVLLVWDLFWMVGAPSQLQASPSPPFSLSLSHTHARTLLLHFSLDSLATVDITMRVILFRCLVLLILFFLCSC